jgi:hypothetical protein
MQDALYPVKPVRDYADRARADSFESSSDACAASLHAKRYSDASSLRLFDKKPPRCMDETFHTRGSLYV